MPEPAADINDFEPFLQWMELVGLEAQAIEAFRYYHGEVIRGVTGIIYEREIETIESLPDAEELSGYEDIGKAALRSTAILKLNGGLGTGMGLAKAKSLLTAKEGLTFLDILAQQTLNLRERSCCAVPLIFMNSRGTHEDTVNRLSRYPNLSVGLPLGFIQNRVPKIQIDGMKPVETGPLEELSWNPPGHGDLYVAIQSSGMLKALLERGIRHVFVSNSDNLGAVIDVQILGYFASKNLPFLMEAADRTDADKKGGHLAQRKRDGRFILRESAQTHAEDTESFQDVSRHKYFNTNNIWLDLEALGRELETGGSVLKLPLIRNEKNLDPRNPDSPRVYQLETAMGSAIEVFEGAAAIRVPRSRFAPVKATSDLLVVWSDAYVLTSEYEVVPNAQNRYGLPTVVLDPKYYRFIDQLESRFPFGAPSLTDCRTLTVSGDVRFGKDVRIVDSVSITNMSSSEVVLTDSRVVTGELLLPARPESA